MRKYTNLLGDQNRMDGLVIIGMVVASRFDFLCC